jgi:hypothetical protein
MLAPAPPTGGAKQARDFGRGASVRRGSAGAAPPASTTKCVNSGDYYLSSPVPCQGTSTPAAEATYFDYGTAIGKYDQGYAANMIRCYTYVANGDADALAFQALVDAQMKRESITEGSVALRTETAGPPLTSPLSVLLKTYAMRAGTDTDLFAFAAIDGGSIAPKSGTSQYDLRLMLSVENSGAMSATRVDTALTFATQAPMQSGQLARSRIVTAAKPQPEATVRWTARNQNNGEQGQIITTQRAIPDFSANRFALSDLVIAEDRDGSWARGPVRLAPSPGHYVVQGTTFRLYHELYGTRDGDSLHISITIAPSREANVLAQLRNLIDRKTAFQVSFDELSAVDATGTGRLVRSIGADLEPGRYLVAVSIRNARSGSVAESVTDLVVLKP